MEKNNLRSFGRHDLGEKIILTRYLDRVNKIEIVTVKKSNAPVFITTDLSAACKVATGWGAPSINILELITNCRCPICTKKADKVFLGDDLRARKGMFGF